MSGNIQALLLILMSAALSSVGQLYLKLGLDESDSARAASMLDFVRFAFGNWRVWLGLVLFATSVIIWMRVLATAQLSWGYPLLGLSYVFVALLGWLVLQEQLGAVRVLGIALVILGAILIARS